MDVVRAAELRAALAQVYRVWSRNPHKTLLQVVDRGAADTGSFIPGDASDDALRASLERVGAGLPAVDLVAPCASCGHASGI